MVSSLEHGVGVGVVDSGRGNSRELEIAAL